MFLFSFLLSNWAITTELLGNSRFFSSGVVSSFARNVVCSEPGVGVEGRGGGGGGGRGVGGRDGDPGPTRFPSSPLLL